KQAICVLRLQKAINFHRMDDPEQEVDVNLVFNLALKDNHQHVTFIARIINLLKNPDAIRQLKELSASQLTEHLYNHIFL
ncbi:MAG: PTS sugar transporter subunit IIA, partial [Lachnospiraceae bacterium]|nr:PTS sugar transporter subunit IIA [Lachnospiraceae bacterium]